MVEEGYVHDVRLVTLGGFLNGEHLAGVTTLYLQDAADFNESGGSFILDGLTLDYLSADLEADTLELASPLAADREDGEPLSISPLTYEKQAVVVLDDFDESLTVVIPHSLHDRLAEGMREDFNRESVSIELEGSTWFLKDVYGIEPVIDGQYLENVVADDILDGIVTNVKLADDAVTATKVAIGAIKPVALSDNLADSLTQKWMETFTDADSMSVTLGTGASFSYVATPDAQVGGKVGQANGYVNVTGKTLIPYEPDTIYRVSARVRTTVQSASGVDQFYVGLNGYAADKVTLVNRNGANSNTSMFYPAASNRSLPSADGWVTVTGYVKGRSAPGVVPTASPAPDIQAPNPLHDGVRYISPRVLLNYNIRDPLAVMQIDSVTVEALRTGVVTANELAANSVTAGKIAALAVQAGNIAALAIQAGDIAANAITTAKLDALAVTSDKIAANAIIASKVAAGAITAEKIDADAINGKTITGATIQTAASGARLVLNASDFTAYNSSNAIAAKLATSLGAYNQPGFATYLTSGGIDYYAALTGSALEVGKVGQANPGFIDYSDLGSNKYALEIVSGNAAGSRSSSSIHLYSETTSTSSDADIDMVADKVNIYADVFAKNIQSGTVTFATGDITANSWTATKVVTFPVPFNSTPTVMLTCSSGGPGPSGSVTFSWITTSVGNTSFGVRMLRSNTNATTFSWLAIST